MKMTIRSGQDACLVIMALLTMVSLRCAAPGVAGGNTSTVDNKVVCGMIHGTDGKPAVNAMVVMRPFDYIPYINSQPGKRTAGTALFVCSTSTDPKGEFRFTTEDSIPSGQYGIEARDSLGNCLFIRNILIDSLFLLSDTRLEIISPEYDTRLKPPSTIRGIVPPPGDSASGMVFVYGLDNYAPIDRDGTFILENIPSGHFLLNIVTVEDGAVRSDAVNAITTPADTAMVTAISTTASFQIDVTRAYQTIDGFGASSAWINSRITSDLAAIFWQDDTLDGHIGLSMLRTRIDPKGYTSAEASPMKKALQANPDMLLWSTSWTPPEQFRTDGHFNTDSTAMQGFADHLVKYVLDVKAYSGIDLYAVSCQNEPDTADPALEGCLWTGEQFRVFLKNYWGPTCEKAGITAKRIIGESAGNDLAITDPSLTDTASARYADIIGTHLYFGGPHPYPLADSLHKPYWVTETSGLGNVDTSITDALAWANQIHDCLVRCNMSAYHYWWLVNSGVADDDEGLCAANGQPTPRMYALGNFSKFIRPGFVRVAATPSPAPGVKISAFLGRSPNRLVVVAVNSGTEMTVDISTTGISSGIRAVPWLTDGTHRLERQQPVTLSDKAFTYALPAKSIVTFVLRDVAIP